MGMARQSELSVNHGLGIPVLVTRPRAQGEAFARALTDRFGGRVRPVIAPLMAPRFLLPDVPDGPFAAVIFTSAQAVEAAQGLPATLPRLAFCVGRSTAAAALRAGFDARSADGDVGDLVAMILAYPPDGRLLYLRGVDTARDLHKILISSDIPILSLQVYLQEAIPFEGESLDLLRQQGPVILPLFSPRSARLFHAARPADVWADLRIVAISAAVADAAAVVPHQAMVIAARPDAAAMLDAVESLLAVSPLP
jgi:uroporphyrinogen-III synthase